jgi:hypothetical protein
LPEPPTTWRLENFLECLDRWSEQENASDDLRLVVTAWILSRFDDPYQRVRREPDFDNLWFGPVPGTLDATGRVIACGYWISETTSVVRCDSIATLGYPL